MNKCKQCGYEIKEQGQPEGFCSEGCSEVYQAIKAMEKGRAA